MRFGLSVPNFGEFADPAAVVELAQVAEAAGWEGFFVWDHINIFGEMPIEMADPWILLTAIAGATRRMAVGPMVTPLPRRRPWVVARQTSTLDRLSGGRLVLGVGLGFPPETEFGAFGEETDVRLRAEKLDEGLAVLAGLWTGNPFEFAGAHYRVERTRFLPPPVQKPRPPIIVAGTWPRVGPLMRAARWDGYFPLKLDSGGQLTDVAPEDVAQIRDRLVRMRAGGPGEIVVTAETKEARLDPSRAIAFEKAGATWYLAGLSTRAIPLETVKALVQEGPPRP